MILAVDAGNTRVKWGVFNDGLLLAEGHLANGELADLPQAWRDLSDCRRAVVSNVAGAEVGKVLDAALAQLGLPVAHARASAEACGVRNAYAHPERLGSDRWAALIAAWQRMHQACIVVNAGTAVTVDALSAEGVFLGGLILPGLRLMRGALFSGTSGIPEATGEWQNFPVTTADAVHTGAVAALAGAVRHLAEQLQAEEGARPACVLSGGDAGLLAPHVPLGAEQCPHLVLEGLVLLEKTIR